MMGADVQSGNTRQVLEVKNLAVGYGRSPIISDCNVTVGQGEVVCLVGPNGDGTDVTRLAPHARVRQGIGYVPQGRQVFSGLSVHDNLRMGCYSLTNRHLVHERIDEVYASFPDLVARRHVNAGHLRGGEQQMLALGRALVTRPKVVLLDEPTLGLAPVAVDRLVDRILELKEKKVTMLMVEQNINVALSISDRGHVVEQGTTSPGRSAAELLSSGVAEAVYLGHRQIPD
jgi:branched-chain amino acid transport system ATP-binding protein